MKWIEVGNMDQKWIQSQLLLERSIGSTVFGVTKVPHAISGKEAKLVNTIIQGTLDSIIIGYDKNTYDVNGIMCYAISTKLADLEPQLEDLTNAIVPNLESNYV